MKDTPETDMDTQADARSAAEPRSTEARSVEDARSADELDPQEPLNYDTEEAAHSWGDLRTWLIIGGLAVALVVSTIIIMLLLGPGKGVLKDWNLGYPPTSPTVIFLVPGPQPSLQ